MDKRLKVLEEELRMRIVESSKYKAELDDMKKARASRDTASVDGVELRELKQQKAAAEKRAEEAGEAEMSVLFERVVTRRIAEANLKTEQQNMWRLKQDFKQLEARLSESGTHRAENHSSANSPKLYSRDSQNSNFSAYSSPASFELQRMQRELKIMSELKEAALQSLDSLRSEMVDGITSIDFSNLRIESEIGSGSFARVSIARVSGVRLSDLLARRSSEANGRDPAPSRSSEFSPIVDNFMTSTEKLKSCSEHLTCAVSPVLKRMQDVQPFRDCQTHGNLHEHSGFVSSDRVGCRWIVGGLATRREAKAVWD